MDNNYIYFLDKAGDVARAKRAIGGQKRKKAPKKAKKPRKPRSQPRRPRKPRKRPRRSGVSPLFR